MSDSYDPMDFILPGSCVHGILQVRILKCVAIFFSRGFSWPRDQTCLSCIGRQIVYHWTTREDLIVGLLLLLLLLLSRFSRVRLFDPIDGSPPGSPVPGILQARTLEWVIISFSNAWKWSHSVVSNSLWPHALQPTRLLRPWDFPGLLVYKSNDIVYP